MKTEANQYLRFLRGVLLLAGPCCLLISAGFGIRVWLQLRNGLRAEGTVVRMATVHGRDGGADMYAPVFIFESTAGRQYTVTSATASDPPEFTVGDRVEVVYQKDRPAGARISSFWQLWFLPMVCVFFAVGLSGAGLLLQIFERWQGREVAAVTWKSPKLGTKD